MVSRKYKYTLSFLGLLVVVIVGLFSDFLYRSTSYDFERDDGYFQIALISIGSKKGMEIPFSEIQMDFNVIRSTLSTSDIVESGYLKFTFSEESYAADEVRELLLSRYSDRFQLIQILQIKNGT
jgi:hypothetical protein